MEEGRKRALQDAIVKIERTYGKGSIMRMGSDAIGKDVPVISTGSLLVDYEALAIGGIPRGRVTEIYGAESSGKTTLALHCISSARHRAVWRRSLMQSMPLMSIMQRNWA
jgi:recombination protein RecA